MDLLPDKHQKLLNLHIWYKPYQSLRLNKLLYLRKLVFICILCMQMGFSSYAQCVSCGNGTSDAGETNLNCPQDIPHNATCTSPCGQPGAFETVAGIRDIFDFTGTTTFSTAGLPAGWTFAGAPTATTAGALPAADAYGAKAGLVQPNCSGSCTGTNGFCIGNLGNNVAVGAGGTGGKLGANFDGRTNINQNLSYAVLRGQNNPTLVSPTYNFSGVEGFKIQFWLFPSESSCGQGNSWGSCVGNAAFLDFSTDGGTSWTQIMTMNLSNSSSDMCFNNSTNTLWLVESNWSRVCLTVFRTTTATGNFYPAAKATTAASGIMVNSLYFTSTFKFRIRYVQTASCTAGITTTNPGRYLAIDYPVITSGNQMIPCGISFSNMCGYGADNNDDGVGSTLTTTTIAHGTVRRSPNQAERGVEIFTSQNTSYASQNITGSAFTTNFDLCNAEGGDKQCINWLANNNFYSVVYECVADWEAASGTGINVQYYKGTTAQSFGMTKVTTVGKTATIGWRYSGSRIVSCGSVSDLNPGCNGYSFRSGSLPLQFARGFYNLGTNSLGEAWSFYGATSCINYFNGPFFAPVSTPQPSASGSYLTCNASGEIVFTGSTQYCSDNAGFTGNASLQISGPNGFSETIISGDTGVVPVTDTGEYIIKPLLPATPTQCMDCARSTCITVTTSDLGSCMQLPVELVNFRADCHEKDMEIIWHTANEKNNAYFELERSYNAIDFLPVRRIIPDMPNSSQPNSYRITDTGSASTTVYYRLKQVDLDGRVHLSRIALVNCNSGFSNISTPANILVRDKQLFVQNLQNDMMNNTLDIMNMTGQLQFSCNIQIPENGLSASIPIGHLPAGIYYISLHDNFSGYILRKRILLNH